MVWVKMIYLTLYFFFSFPEEQNIAKLHKHLVIFDYDESPKET